MTQLPATRARRRSTGPGRARRRRRESMEGWLFVAPIALGIAAFQLVPLAVSLYTSLTNWDGIAGPRFIGLRNYTDLITNDFIFLQVLRNTLLFTVISVPLTIVCAVILALFANLRIRGLAFFRTAFFAPYVMNIVAIGYVWSFLYQPDGILNSLLGAVGIQGPSWLADANWVLIAVIVVNVWQGVGYPMVILLGGLQNIPAELYDAARLDGAGRWARLFRVTLPLLTPQIFFVVLAQFISSFQVFGLIYVMTQGGPAFSSSVYIYYLWQVAFSQGKFGYASAMAWLMVLLIAVVSWIQWRLQRKWVFYG